MTIPERLLTGVAAGFAATIPMTIIMEVFHKRLPFLERYPLPPRRITDEAARSVGLLEDLREPDRRIATMAAHFGYGTAMGAAYAVLARPAPLPAPVRGAAWGLAVWAGSYLAALPALRMHRSARVEPRERNLLMLAAHVVWGAALGTIADAMSSDE